MKLDIPNLSMTKYLLWLSLAILPQISLAANASDDVEASWDVKFQTTYNWQRHPSYAATYTGPNSLISGHEKMYTFSTTAFLGYRPWQNAELYFDPEVAQGVPFSTNLVGMGGYTNGEITRAAGTSPVLYRQQLFLRQTWNNGGETQHLDANLNQLTGWQDRDRVVLTAGNFSTLNVLDQNTYAKDPRTQFMNWGNWTYAAYDYAADARGFGWGIALEWYKDKYALRYARMTGPKDPNGLPLDFALGAHYGDQFEIIHEHELYGHPGKLSVLGWRIRAKLSSFNDALAWLTAHPGPQNGPAALIATRYSEKIKYGLGLNLEQALNDESGYFLRVMQADGRTETQAFTEVDASVSTGLVIKGSAWGRNTDGIGISIMQNRLSQDRRNYLAAGGISFFIGDGKLNYRPEDTFEGYYSWGVYKGLWLTADYQRMVHPAYNADRGPIDVYALRIHAEY